MEFTSLRTLIVYSFLSELNMNRTLREKLCETEAAAKRYAKNVKQTPLTIVLKKPESI